MGALPEVDLAEDADAVAAAGAVSQEEENKENKEEAKVEAKKEEKVREMQCDFRSNPSDFRRTFVMTSKISTAFAQRAAYK